MSENLDELKAMLQTFRVSELQMILGYAGRNKSGRKSELQTRAIELLRVRSHPIQTKIRELYKTIQQSGALNNATQSGTPSPPIGNMPQPQGNLPRATLNPYSSQMSTRHQTAVANAAGYNQTNALYQNTYPGYAAVMASHGVSQPAQQFTGTTQQQNNNTGNAILRSGTVIHQVNSYPVHPDVHFKRLPFFDVLSDLLRPSTLMPSTTQRLQDGHYQFHLTPQQATDIASSRDCRQGSKFEYTKQVQMRFCLLETTCEQEDCFPSQLIVKVNNKLAPLPNPVPTNKPGVEPKRPPKPVNITPYIKLSPVVANNIHVQWGVDYGRPFAISVSLVHKRNSSDLLQRLKSRGAKNSDYTRSLIKEKLNEDADSEIATTCLRVSLLCPLGKMRMMTPCRASTCQHLQCFDASLYLQMNERKATWNCPVCDKPAIYDNLVIDGYFQEVLSSSILRNDTNEITLHKDGSWSLTTNEKKVQPVVKKVEEPDDSVTIIGDDVELVESKPKLGNLVKAGAASNKDGGDSTASITATVNRSVVDLTISDSDDDDEPLAKRRATIQQQQQQAQLVQQQQQQQQQQAAKPDSTNVKFSDTTSISSSSNLSSHVSTTPGPSSVSSSGYPASPAIITLDSPSPPLQPSSSPQPQQAIAEIAAIITSPVVSTADAVITTTTAGGNCLTPQDSPVLFVTPANSPPGCAVSAPVNAASMPTLEAMYAEAAQAQAAVLASAAAAAAGIYYTS